MIEITNEIFPDGETMDFVVEGMRNPMNSWINSDSHIKYAGYVNEDNEVYYTNEYILGEKDKKLMKNLSSAGKDHRKFMRMMNVYVRINAPLYWWKEFDTYKVGTVANSCSTMHRIMEKEFKEDMFSWENMYMIDVKQTLLAELNFLRARYKQTKNKKDWYCLIQALPSSYNQTRNVMLNYEVLTNIYNSRKNHKLNEWRDFCKWIEDIPYSWLIVGENNAKSL